MSFLSWIDFDETDRQRVRRIMALFDESEARDELGMGSIRDSIADHLFPGVTTLHTRLRYVLFVPWIFKEVERSGLSADRLESERRAREVELIDALLAGGEVKGVIGRNARALLKRFPSSIYWEALRSWGIRRLEGSPEEMRSGSQTIWAAGIPGPSTTWPNEVSFDLTPDEAGFLVDRIVNSQPESLLAYFAKTASAVDCEYVWAHPGLASFPPAARTLVEHAHMFSSVMLGAQLLYNLLLSRKREKPDWVGRYERGIESWISETLVQDAVKNWSLEDFWNTVRHPNHRIRRGAREFVESWRQLAVRHGRDILVQPGACRLVMDREQVLKGGNSRFKNSSALDRWHGSAGAARLNFRWPVVKSHIRDIADAVA